MAKTLKEYLRVRFNILDSSISNEALHLRVKDRFDWVTNRLSELQLEIQFGPPGQPHRKVRYGSIPYFANQNELQELEEELEFLDLLLAIDREDEESSSDILIEHIWSILDKVAYYVQLNFAYQLYDQFREELSVEEAKRTSVWLQARVTEEESLRLEKRLSRTVRMNKSQLINDWIDRGLLSTTKPRFPQSNANLSQKICVRCPWATANELKKRAKSLGVTSSKLMRSYIVRGIRNSLPRRSEE